ncbi:MAG: aminotransferase class I/II-fold pyridoxal phosphate-dependent enzyme, partial [Anaerolineales bacterium]
FMVAPLALAHRLELLVTHSTGCTATFTQDAGIAALSGPQDAVDEVVVEYQRRRDRLLELVNAIPGVHARKPEGAFYVFPNVKSFGIPSKELARRILDEAGVAVLSGTDFGPGGEGYIRIAYATSMEQIEEGMARLAAFFARLA